VSVTECNPAGSYRTGWTRLIELAGCTSAEHASVKANAETIGGQSVDVVTTKIDALDLRMILGGPNFGESRTATLSGLILETSGGGKTAMAELLQAFSDKDSKFGAAAEPAFRNTRAELGAKANLIAMLDIPRCLGGLFRLQTHKVRAAPTDAEKAKIAAAEQARMKDLTEFAIKLDPSYCGLSLATEPDGVTVRLRIPREQILGIAKAFENLGR
jgi:hypothetical protein